MILFILERVPPALRGELTRWMIEPQSGVFVGSVSALVRDKLWEYISQNSRGGGCMMIYTMNNEQGFAVRFFGVTSRFLEDYDGLTLVRVQE